MREPATKPSVFEPLRNPSYRRLWLGAWIVFVGVMCQAVARGWLAFHLTGSNAAIGGVMLAFGLTLIVVTPVAGMVGDRFAKRAVMAFSIVLLVVTSAWIGLAVAWGTVAYWNLVVVSVAQGVAFALYGPARTAFVTSLVPERQYPEAVTLMMISVEVSRVVGPLIAGVALGATYGMQGVFLGSAALFLLGLLAVLSLPRGAPGSPDGAVSQWGDIVAGISYVRDRRDLSLLLGCVLAVSAIALPHLVLLPAVSETFDRAAAGYGLLSALSAAAAVTAGLLGGRLRRRVGPWPLVVWSGAVLGLSLVALAAAPSYGLALVAVVPLGAGMLMFDTAAQALFMQRSEQRFHARMQAMLTLGIAGYGVFALPLGVLADVVGLRTTLAGMGCAVLAVVAVFWARSRPWWNDELPSLSPVVAGALAEERAVL